MPRQPTNHSVNWTASELKKLKVLARTASVAQAARTLGRTAAATQQRAMRAGISFRRRSKSMKKK